MSAVCNDCFFICFLTVLYSYAEVSVTSEESLKMLLEKVPGCKLHGETIDCRFATLQNLSIFEEKASQRKGRAILGKWFVCIYF